MITSQPLHLATSVTHGVGGASELGNDRWLPRAEFQSNRFTTRWNELLIV